MNKDNAYVLEKIETLRPKPSPKKLIRIGGDRDGAYLLPNDLLGIKACFSPGVSNRKDFEDELLDVYNIPSHMCDFSSDPDRFRTPLKPGQTFKKKWLDVNGSADSISLEEWVQELAPNPADDLILQIDIEGAEYRNILNTPDYILKRFRIIVIELHRLKVCNRPDDFDVELGPLLKILDNHFVCVHAHPNNCSGDFNLIGSKLNLPNVHELTFLRRDRWQGVAVEDCHQPMLPHPLDIAPNVSSKAPVYLNEHWLLSGKRTHESTIKMLTDQVDFLKREQKRFQGPAPHGFRDTLSDLHLLARRISDNLPVKNSRPLGDLVDLAIGKNYTINAKESHSQAIGIIRDECPFFFHTREGRNQSITIDLQVVSTLFELQIANRTDTCLERARCLFYCLHDDELPDLRLGLPVVVDEGFLTEIGKISVTNLRGVQARYLTIFSPENTILHFSSIKILGLVAE